MVRQAGTINFEGDIRNGCGTGFFTFVANDSFVREMASLGYSGLSEDRIDLFALQDVTTDMVRELQTLGYDGLSEETLVQFAIHGVSPQFIRQMNDLGYTDIEPTMLVQLRIHGLLEQALLPDAT